MVQYTFRQYRGHSLVPELNPLFANRASGLTIANRRFEAIRANRSHVMKIGVFLRIDSRESITLRIAGPSKSSTLVDKAVNFS